MKYLVTYTVEVEADSEGEALLEAKEIIWDGFVTIDVQLMDEHDKLTEELNNRITRDGRKVRVPSAENKTPNLSSYLDYRYED